MDTLSVFQEQSMLLYVIAGLLVVLIVTGIGIWLKLDAAVQVLKGQPSNNEQPKLMNLNPYGSRPERDETTRSAESGWYVRQKRD